MKKTKLLVLLMTMFVVQSFYSAAYAQSAFTPGNLVILRSGDGSATLSTASTVVYLEEFSTTGTTVQSFALPTTGVNKLTIAGSSGTEGQLTLSPDSYYLVVAGYDAEPGTAGIAATASATVNRKLLKVDNAVTYSSLLSATAFSTKSIRCGVTNGNDFWASGDGNAGTNGVQYFGNGTPCQVTSTKTNLRGVNIFNGQLYFSTGSAPTGIYAVGTGLPITSGTVSTLEIAGVGSSPSPNAFAINAANDICYVADDRLVSAGGGVVKYTKTGGVWSLSYVLSTGTNGARGLTVDWSGANPVIYATTSETSANRLVKFEDLGASSPLVLLYTAATNTMLKGVAFAPAGGSISVPTTQTSNFTFSNILQTQMSVSWTPGNGSKRVVKINTVNSFTAPGDGTDPPANAVYSGSGEQVIYNGAGSTIPIVSGLTTSTTYWFQAWEYNGTGGTTLYCTGTGTNNPLSQASAAAATAPLISSPTVASITATGATLGGDITADGGSPITERGTIWSTSTPVTIADNKVIEGGVTTGVFTHARTGMPSNTLIYYAAYAMNSAGTTLTAESSFTTLFGEPANQAESFAATSPSYSSVTNTWLDNDGIPAATGFLILANTTGTFTDPVDGVQAPSDIDLGNGSGLVYVSHGQQTFTWTGLTSSTPYYFAIYAYTNTGSNIDYKLIPAAPTANVTTLPFINPVAAWTFDALAATPATPTSVAAEFGDQIGTAMLYADGTNGSSTWLQAGELNSFGGTTLNDPREGAAIFDGMAFVVLPGTGLSGNGKSLVIKFSMSALQDPILTFATRGTSTGFDTHQWEWSTDGVTFTGFGTNTAVITSTYLLKTLDMSAIDALDGAPSVYIRVTFTGGSSTTGNNRLDNIVVRASSASTIAPTVATTVATDVTATTATLNGTVNANNQTTSVYFEFGTAQSTYGAPVAAVPATVNGGITTSVAANLTGLLPFTTYYYRVSATNGSGTTYGSELTLVTGCLPTGEAGQISGPTTVYADGTTQYQFTVPAIENAANYIWSFPLPSEIVAGDGTNTVTVVFYATATSGNASVFATNDCDEEGGLSEYAISIIFVPASLSVNGLVEAGMANCYAATQTITVAGNSTTFEVMANGSATMKAGMNILYLPGTTVHSGGYMLGTIVPNGPFCSGKAPAMPIAAEVSGLSIMDNTCKIYPNPTTGVFTVEQIGESTVNNARIEVYGMLGGKILSTEMLNSRKHDVSIQGSPSGIYFVKIMSGEKVQTVKIVLTN